MHLDMNAKRRRELQALGRHYQAGSVRTGRRQRPARWLGQYQGSLREATERARKVGDGVSASRSVTSIRTGAWKTFLPANVYVVENNDEGLYDYGQLCALLRAKYCDSKIEALTRPTDSPGA